jgi:sialate O-acetylesterase
MFRKLALVLFVLCIPCAQAALRLPALFGDNMVLQVEQPLPVWGWAGPGEAVYVTLPGQAVATHADANGAWSVRLQPLALRPEPFTLTIATATEIKRINNVLAGDVWLCSGQSNMQMPLAPFQWSLGVYDYEKTIAQADHPTLRLFMVPIAETREPQQDVKGAWVVCTPQTAAGFSALGYFFGRELNQQLKRPIGLIQSAAGGTLVQQWMSPASVAAVPGYKHLLERFERGKQQYTAAFAQYEAARARWLAAGGAQSNQPQPAPPAQELASLYPDRAEQVQKQLAQYEIEKAAWLQANGAHAGQPAPAVPVQETILPAPARLYAAMIQPLIPFALKGVIWYQGEGNTGDPYNYGHPSQYRELFPALINGWRRAWGQGELPFYFCQLPNFAARAKPAQVADAANPEEKTTFPAGDAWPEHSWPELREAQADALKLPHTGMAVLIDIGDAYDIHPRNKQAAGQRLARVALAQEYGMNLDAFGPRYRAPLRVQNGRAVLRFDHAAGGLTAQDGTLKGFSIAGPDQQFFPAEAAIEGNRVTVWSAQVPHPVAVRYAWTANPWATLTNRQNLPAPPFRTDPWPLKKVHQIEPMR